MYPAVDGGGGAAAGRGEPRRDLDREALRRER